MTNVNLGDKVKDTVTGFKGVAIGRTIWLHGCARITVQPEGLTKEGKLFDTQAFDEPQLEVIKNKIKEGNHLTGGFDIKVNQKLEVKK